MAPTLRPLERTTLKHPDILTLALATSETGLGQSIDTRRSVCTTYFHENNAPIGSPSVKSKSMVVAGEESCPLARNGTNAVCRTQST